MRLLGKILMQIFILWSCVPFSNNNKNASHSTIFPSVHLLGLKTHKYPDACFCTAGKMDLSQQEIVVAFLQLFFSISIYYNSKKKSQIGDILYVMLRLKLPSTKRQILYVLYHLKRQIQETIITPQNYYFINNIDNKHASWPY